MPLDYDTTKLPNDELKMQLLAQRPDHPVLAPASEATLVRSTDNWVRTWIDPENTVTHRSGRIVASRAITQSGLLIWMVQQKGNRFAFHADRDTAEEAFKQASQARRARKAIASRWPEIVKLRHRILMGRTRLTVSVDDARRAGLCELGVQGFLHRIGLGGRTEFSGKLLAMLSFMDRHVTYAMFAAYQRQVTKQLGHSKMELTRDEPSPV